MSYLGTVWPDIEETTVIYEISTFEFVKMRSFVLKKTN